MVNGLVIDEVTVGSDKSLSLVSNTNINAVVTNTNTTSTSIRSINSIQPVILSSLNNSSYNNSSLNHSHGRFPVIGTRTSSHNKQQQTTAHSSSLLHSTNVCSKQQQQQQTSVVNNNNNNATLDRRDGRRGIVNPNVNLASSSASPSSSSVISFRPTNYILLNKLRVQTSRIRRSTNQTSSSSTIDVGKAINKQPHDRHNNKINKINNVMEPNGHESTLDKTKAMIQSNKLMTNHNPLSRLSSPSTSYHQTTTKKIIENGIGHTRFNNSNNNPRPIITRVNAPYWLNAQKKDSFQSVSKVTESQLWYPSSSSVASCSTSKEHKKSTNQKNKQSKSLTNSNHNNLNYSIDLAQSKPVHRYSCQASSTSQKVNESSKSSGIVCFQTSTMDNNDYTSTLSNAIQTKSSKKSIITDDRVFFNSNQTENESKQLNERINVHVVNKEDKKINEFVQCDKMIRVNNNIAMKNVDNDNKTGCNILTNSEVISDKTTTTTANIKNNSSSKQINNLLKFIERSSPEFIFLLDKSANLSYQIALFERKLDYLEKIFNNNINNNSHFVSCNKKRINEESVLWSKVINRTRNWIAKSRKKNIFITNFHMKLDVDRSDNKLFESKEQVINEWKTIKNDEQRNNIFFDATNGGNVSYSSLSSKDELIILLERIAQFSSNIISQRKLEHKYLKSHVVNNTVVADLNNSKNGILNESIHVEYDEVSSTSNHHDGNNIIDDDNKKYMNNSLIEENDSKLFINKLLDVDVTENEQMKNTRQLLDRLQPEVLKALVQIVKTNSLLVQVQREFDILMCSHIKSFSELLSKQTQQQQQQQQKLFNHVIHYESQFMGTSLPLSFNGNHHHHHHHHHLLKNRFQSNNNNNNNNNVRLRSSMNQQQQQFIGQKYSNNGTMNNKQEHTTLASHCKNSGKIIMNNENDITFGDCCNKLQNCNNFVSDGDSGGEFTATTVTNEFNQCVTDDELSSLLNQIAICSQKIIEQSNSNNNNNNGTASSSNNSTSSSGCCCSTSIEAKCTGTYNMNNNHHQNQQHQSQSKHHSCSVNKDISSHYGHHQLSEENENYRMINLATSWSNDINKCYNCNNSNEMARFHSNHSNGSNNRTNNNNSNNHNNNNSNCCHHQVNTNVSDVCNSNMSFNNNNNLHMNRIVEDSVCMDQQIFGSNINRSYHNNNAVSNNNGNNTNINQCTKKMMHSHATHNFMKPSPTSNILENFTPSFNNCNLDYQPSSHNVMMSTRRSTQDQYIGWPLDEPLINRVSNNMTGFMLSSSAFDIMSPHMERQYCSRYHNGCHHHHQQQCKAEQCNNQLNECINHATNNTRAFIFDPNVDVESFLNEVEKELDENRFTSAPPFMNPETSNYENNNRQSRGRSRQTHHRCSSNNRLSMRNRVDESYCPQAPSQLLLESVPVKCEPAISSYSSLLVTNVASNAASTMPTPILGSMHSESHPHHHNLVECPSRCSDPIHQSLILAGGNWKLSNRNSVNDFGRFNISMGNSHNSSAMTSLMANGSTSSSVIMDRDHLMNPFNNNSNNNPVSQDLLDKYRSQVSYRVNEETDRQLKEIDQWLYRHLKQTQTGQQISNQEQGQQQQQQLGHQTSKNYHSHLTDLNNESIASINNNN